MGRPHFKIQVVFFFAILCGFPLLSPAEVGVVVYDSTGKDIYLANAGVTGVYLSNVCIADQPNRFRVCTGEDHQQGNNGTVVRRLKKVAEGSDEQWLAVKANQSFNGTERFGDAPIFATAGRTQSLLAADYYQKEQLGKLLDPQDQLAPGELPAGQWQDSIGTRERRDSHVVALPTDSIEDQRVVDWLNRGEYLGKFNDYNGNCAKFADRIFQIAKGAGFNGKGGFEDFGASTPTAIAKEVKKFSKINHEPYEVIQFDQVPGTLRRSVQPTELAMESNTQELVNLPISLFASPVSTPITGFKYARKYFGLSAPGFRDYLSLDKEVRTHGDAELAALSLELSDAKEDGVEEAVKSIKAEIQEAQDEQFGSKNCWNNQKDIFYRIMAQAFARKMVNPRLEKYFKNESFIRRELKLIPYLFLDTVSRALIKRMIPDESKVSPSSDGIVVESDGVTAGLTRNNILEHDPKMGFLIMAILMNYDLQITENRRPSRLRFDSDWKIFIEAGRNLGLTLGDQADKDIRSCVEEEKTRHRECVVSQETPTSSIAPAVTSTLDVLSSDR